MVKVIKKTLPSRRKLASPYSSDTLQDRLAKSGAKDLHHNNRETYLGYGYVSIYSNEKN